MCMPRVSNYLTQLQAALAESGVAADLKVTKSNGGVMSAEHGKQNCAADDSVRHRVGRDRRGVSRAPL